MAGPSLGECRLSQEKPRQGDRSRSGNIRDTMHSGTGKACIKAKQLIKLSKLYHLGPDDRSLMLNKISGFEKEEGRKEIY